MGEPNTEESRKWIPGATDSRSSTKGEEVAPALHLEGSRRAQEKKIFPEWLRNQLKQSVEPPRLEYHHQNTKQKVDTSLLAKE